MHEPTELPAPTLAEFWAALQRAKSAVAAPEAASSGGSNGGGYGLSLIAPDADAQRRIDAIMRDLRARGK